MKIKAFTSNSEGIIKKSLLKALTSSVLETSTGLSPFKKAYLVIENEGRTLLRNI
jgi:hypothetical protein